MTIAACLLVAAPASAQQAPPGFFGIDGSTDVADDFTLMAEANVGAYRNSFSMRGAALAKGEPYYWGRYDAEVRGAATAGIEMIPVLYGVPKWLSEDLGANPIRTKGAMPQWRKFITATVRRYGPGGEFWALNPAVPYQPVTIWQIWNEPNSITWWRPRPRAREYGKLLIESARAIKGVDPGARVMAAGLSSRPTNRHAILGPDFIRGMLSSRFARRYTDVVALHPYAATVGAVRRQIGLARKAMKKSGLRSAPLWITEIGWGVGGPRKHPLFRRTSSEQVRILRGTFKMALRERRRFKLEKLFWYHWRDGNDDLCRWCVTSGLLDRYGDPKPLFDAFQSIARR